MIASLASFWPSRRAVQSSLASALLAALALVLCTGVAYAQRADSVQAAASLPASLAAAWSADRVIDYPPALLDSDTVVSRLRQFAREAPDLFSVEEIGRSVEDRPIDHAWFGHGPFHVLLWSQMHGDEATATASLLDMLGYVRRERDDPRVRRMLQALTVHVVPMLNPDGAARFQRRNAQGIDVNRDALLLQSPEGRALKALRDRLKPRLGFNLHNENWKTSAGRTGKPASFSLLAVAFDPAGTETPGRILAKKTCAIVDEALERFAPGQVARYDEDFEVRAFGDNVTKWGTPVVLIETGPYQGDQADTELARLNFVAILTALDALATGRVQGADPGRYARLPRNDDRLFTVLIQNASIVTGTGIAPFTGDVGLASNRVVRPDDTGGPRELAQVFRVDDLGDLRVFFGLETVDATGLVLAPHPVWAVGDQVEVADWKTFKTERPIAVGTSTRMVLLRESAPGTFRVIRVFPADRKITSGGFLPPGPLR